MAGSRPLSDFWNKPGKNSVESATLLIKQWRPAIEKQVSYYNYFYPSEIDWDTVIWMGAYRAAFAWKGYGSFWKLLRKCISWSASNYLATYHRRRERLRMVGYSIKTVDEKYYYFDVEVT